MKLRMNREFAVRHLGVAVLMAGMCAWFLHDGAVAYPQRDETWFAENLHKTKEVAIERQFEFAGLAGLAALVIALGVLRVRLQTLEWDGESMCGSLSGGRPLAFGDVESVDLSKWGKKGIAVLLAKDGRRVRLDAWHHSGVKELVARFCAKEIKQ